MKRIPLRDQRALCGLLTAEYCIGEFDHDPTKVANACSACLAALKSERVDDALERIP